MRPLTPAVGALTAPPSESQMAPNVSVDARVLVITADGTDAAFEAIEHTLGLLGTPYDVLNATTGPALIAGMLASGDQGKYQAIFLDVGDLSDNGASAFTDDEWTTLSSYEARFGVRRVALYTYPTTAYGLVAGAGAVNPETSPIDAHCTGAGAAAFVGANCANPITIDMGWAYPASAAGARTVPLLTDDAGNVFAATTSYPDGREALVLTFAQAPYALHSLQLGYGLVSWATRGLFVGERHAYLCAQIDDLFLASDIYPATGLTYRMTGADMQALADWQAARRANPLTAGLRLAWAANLQGSRGVASDGLTAKAVELGPTFSWISHTWDHADLTTMSYADAYQEFSLNDQTIRGLGLQPYATANLVTPGITGLDNAMAMQAAYDVGIRYLVSDTSIPGRTTRRPTPVAPTHTCPGSSRSRVFRPTSTTTCRCRRSGRRRPPAGRAGSRPTHRSSPPRAGCSPATCCKGPTTRGCSTRRTRATSAAATACSAICSGDDRSVPGEGDDSDRQPEHGRARRPGDRSHAAE
jgi:hypothetical protein